MRIGKRSAHVAITALTAMTAQIAHADVLYSFDGTIVRQTQIGNLIHNIKWDFVTPDFITADRTVLPADLAMCTATRFVGVTQVGSVSCGEQSFRFGGGLGNFVDFKIIDPLETTGFLTGYIGTPSNAFSTFGTYRDGYPIAGGNLFGRLTVSLAPDVPEPASWAMMIAGFGLVGGMMRRRETKVSYA
jgi:hypothetical protein